MGSHVVIPHGVSVYAVRSNVPGESYDYVVGLVRSRGVYPLTLKEFDMEMT